MPCHWRAPIPQSIQPRPILSCPPRLHPRSPRSRPHRQLQPQSARERQTVLIYLPKDLDAIAHPKIPIGPPLMVHPRPSAPHPPKNTAEPHQSLPPVPHEERS